MRDLSKEIFFKTARSGGKGGQNVNKVETMVEAYWHVGNSLLFTEAEKEILQRKLITKINKEGFLMMKSSMTRSQLENKILAQKKLEDIVAKSLIILKKRRPSIPTKSSIEKRIFSKKIKGAKKESRKRSDNFTDD